MRMIFVCIVAAITSISMLLAGCTNPNKPVGMAVEFNAHATSAYTALEKGWYAEEGLSFTAHESYVTGMALASSLARGDIGVAYMCLVPAITAYANAGVDLKIIAGTHKDGYGLAVNPDKIKAVDDLQNPGIRIASVQPGGAVDEVLNKTIDYFELDKKKVLDNTLRMNPARALISIQSGQVDAVFLPEQWSSMAEEYGFEMLLESKDVWPGLQGGVLVVKQELINSSPETIKALLKVDSKTVDWINSNPEEASQILSSAMQGTIKQEKPTDSAFETAAGFDYSPEVMLRAINRINFSPAIEISGVQEVIDYLEELDYIRSSFPAEEIMDLSFLLAD